MILSQHKYLMLTGPQEDTGTPGGTETQPTGRSGCPIGAVRLATWVSGTSRASGGHADEMREEKRATQKGHVVFHLRMRLYTSRSRNCAAVTIPRAWHRAWCFLNERMPYKALLSNQQL